jgi:DNA (cytosine-5)-methyltransferase 1
MPELTVGSLFAGIGGLDLGADRSGFDVIWQCEKDDYCTRVLNKHWPDVPVYNDVQTLYTEDGPQPRKPDVLCGGFPSQDISYAGTGRGLSGDRSGLWWEFARTIGVVEPRYVVVENVPALTRRGLDAILGWLAENGYDAEWQIVSAAAMGAPHIRERLFVVAYPPERTTQRRGALRRTQQAERASCGGETNAETLSDPDSSRRGAQQRRVSKGESDTAGKCEAMADAARKRCDQRAGLRSVFSEGQRGRRLHHCCLQKGGQKWQSEPDVDRLADGVPDRVDRLRGLGNAVVPQVSEFVFSCIRDHYQDQ